MVFPWSLIDSKSLQVSRTLLGILADLIIAVVCMVSVSTPISDSSSPLPSLCISFQVYRLQLVSLFYSILVPWQVLSICLSSSYYYYYYYHYYYYYFSPCFSYQCYLSVFYRSSSNTMSLYVFWTFLSILANFKDNVLSMVSIFPLIWFGLFGWVLWHIHLCRLSNAKSIFIQIISSISNNSF